MATETNDHVPGLPQPQPPEEEQVSQEELALTQPSGLAERVKLEAEAGAWLRRRDPYAA